MISIAKIFLKHLKLYVRYFFETPYNILGGKKSKIVRVTARSIWNEIPHIQSQIIHLRVILMFYINVIGLLYLRSAAYNSSPVQLYDIAIKKTFANIYDEIEFIREKLFLKFFMPLKATS